MKEKRNWDYCKILTKDHLIDFLKEYQNHNCFGIEPPTEREVKYFKWKIESEAIQKKIDNHIKDYASCTDTDDFNALRAKLNNEKVVLKRLKILEKMSKISAKIDDRHDKFGKLINKSQRIDKLLE